FVEYLVRNFPEAKILVLTMVSNPMILAELYSAGVWGVLLKHEKLTEITGAIYNVRLGNKYYPQSYSKQEQESAGKDTIEEKVNALSPREFEVLRLFVRGEGVAQIAQNLNRSVKTVSTQKRSAMKKLGVQTDQDLIAFCVEHAMFS
ncbi:MAG: LuxR C-terminal-related transcriptional regulator, partial [Comamonadaceae bacterium]|nr:LuxR C-terminal-related transcriptional regulator [Comamonadaceae bacterium]